MLRSRKERRELLARIVNDGHRLATTALNVVELYTGVRPGEETRIAFLLDSLHCYGLDANTGKQAGLLKNAWANRGKTISLPDAVAATAIERGCTLLTDNRKDSPMPELKLFPLP